MNLVDDAWIPALTRSGPRVYGLREVLKHADDVAAIHTGNPLVDAALLRLLFAIDFASEGNSQQWLEEHRQRFELFDRDVPFAQNAELERYWDEPKAARTVLWLSQPNSSPESMVHSYRHAASGVRYTPAQAARYLVMRQHFSTGGIQSYVGSKAPKSAKGSLAATRPFVWIDAGSLSATLRANRLESSPIGTFHFTWPEGVTYSPPDETTPDGVVSSLTWLARNVLLHRDAEGMVDVHQLSDGMRAVEVSPEVMPYTSFRKLKKNGPFTPWDVHVSRPGWRQLLVAYAENGPGILAHTGGKTGVLRLTGLASTQSLIDGTISGVLPIPRISPDQAADLDAAMTESKRISNSAVGSVGVRMNPGASGAISDRWGPAAQEHLLGQARPIVFDAFAGTISPDQACDRLIANGTAAALRFAHDISTINPGLAGQSIARTLNPYKGTKRKEKT